MTLNKDDPEPLRYYDWIGWKLRQEEQKKKQANMQSDNIEMKGWENHEDSFEETLRREMLKYKELYHLLQEDQKQLTESYYKILKKNKELIEFNELLQKSNRELIKKEI